MILRRGFAIFLILVLSVSLSACGKKSSLEPPPGDKKQEYPGVYPKK
ncbi:MAG: lipoprotein [Rhodospirillales bacterium]|nr:lipoprotein [Rhodospirillales bacterium]MDP6642829.1 lipoprotein [Rhodospirillales bacterium]MDP6841248.1 lipoprotein [Rhodospirillales bacterium]